MSQQPQSTASAPPPPGGDVPGYPSQGTAPYPDQYAFPQLEKPGQAPYPSQGQGQAPYPPSQGQATNQGQMPVQGQTPYPNQGQMPVQGQTPYPNQGQMPAQGQTPYPNQGQMPAQGQTPYQGQAPHPGQGQAQHPNLATQFQQGLKIDEMKSKVEIRVECKNLLNKDLLSKSDPCAAFYILQNQKWVEVGRTEKIKNCLDPKFARSFVVNYFFEEVQKVRICVYDLDNDTVDLADDDFLGYIETTLGQLVSCTPMTKPLILWSGKNAGTSSITVSTEEKKNILKSVKMTFRAAKLDNKDFFGKSDPYMEFSKVTPSGSWQVIHRTEVVKNNLNPSWKPFELNIQTLCDNDMLQNIKVDCFDWDSDGSHDLIGSFTTTLQEMAKAGQQEVMYPCVNQAKKAKKKKYTNSGCIYLSSCQIVQEYSFLDFIMTGTQINFTVGIDFTASNGNPANSNSLHYINPHQPNQYMAAIRSVGDVCQDYDSDKMFPVLGFGAKIPPLMEVSHEFAVNFNYANPYCAGIDGVLGAYYNCIQQVQLYGPTNASPIINHVAGFARTAQQEESSKGPHAYYILLILTDGVLTDMSLTKGAVVQASSLPMSIIIVGVGNANFDDMEELDGDDGVLRDPSGNRAKRDIVQFVPFRDFKNVSSSQVELARHVLAEVPKQVTDYFKWRGLPPLKKVSPPTNATA